MGEALSALGLDAFKLGAQVINFLLLVLLLNHFAFKPLLKIIADRQKTAVKNEELKTELEKLKEEIILEKKKALERAQIEASYIINQSKKEAEEIKATLLKKAEAELKKKEVEFNSYLETKKAEMQAELTEKITEIITLAVEKTLSEKPNLNKKITAYYLSRIK